MSCIKYLNKEFNKIYEFNYKEISKIFNLIAEATEICSDSTNKYINYIQKQILNREITKEVLVDLVLKFEECHDEILSATSRVFHEYIITKKSYQEEIKRKIDVIVETGITYCNSQRDCMLLAKRVSYEYTRYGDFCTSFLDDYMEESEEEIHEMMHTCNYLLHDLINNMYEEVIEDECFRFYPEEDWSYIDVLLNYIDTLDEYREIHNLYINNKNLNIEEFEKIKTKKIFKYREMEKLALENGYVYKYSNGDHKIYEHSVSKVIIVIPAKDLGKGLSCAIQKQIKKNAVV